MRSVFLRGDDAPRSPRIFKKRIRRADDGVRPGEVVALRTSDGTFFARAFYSPRSVIGARVLDRVEDGPPIDAAWFREKIASANALRTEVLGLPEVTNAYRVVHAEGDGLSGLIIDRYNDVAVIELGCRGMFEQLDHLEDTVKDVCGVDRVVVRADARIEEIEGFRAVDRRTGSVTTEIVEYDLGFKVDCTGGHKTGFFIDQRDSRYAVGGWAEGRRVWDLCCYTGGFTLAAAAGGATEVVGVDLDEDVIALAEGNAQANGLTDTTRFVHADAFDFLREAPGAAPDFIVLDPPKLAPRRELLGRARSKSVDLNRLAIEAIAPGGLMMTFSCTGLWSIEDVTSQVREAAGRAGKTVRVLGRLDQPSDHPVQLDCLESRYLTGLFLQVEA